MLFARPLLIIIREKLSKGRHAHAQIVEDDIQTSFQNELRVFP
jgi:hypothetical protein